VCSKESLSVLLPGNRRPDWPDSPSPILIIRESTECAKDGSDPALPEWRYVPCVVSAQTGEDDNGPKYQLRPHPPLPVFEA